MHWWTKEAKHGSKTDWVECPVFPGKSNWGWARPSVSVESRWCIIFCLDRALSGDMSADHLSHGKECIGNTTSPCVLKLTLLAYFQISRRQCFVNTMTPKKQLQGFQRKGDGGPGHGGSLLGTITNWFFCYLT